MKSTHMKTIKQKLIESYMSELRLNLVHECFGLSNMLIQDIPTNNALLKARMKEIESLYAQESEAQMSRRLK
jgi:hypothetical protein